jgi:hypothetical protein
MGEGDLLLGPHEQTIGGIGGIERTTPRRGGPLCPYGPHAPWALEDAQNRLP